MIPLLALCSMTFVCMLLADPEQLIPLGIIALLWGGFIVHGPSTALFGFQRAEKVVFLLFTTGLILTLSHLVAMLVLSFITAGVLLFVYVETYSNSDTEEEKRSSAQ